MKHIKIHSFTHLLHLLYCLILALPLCTILVRCLYVQFNKNAFESYYGETINQKQEVSQRVQDCLVGETYTLITPNTISYQIKSGNTQIMVQNVVYNGAPKDVDELRFYINTGTSVLTIQGIGTEGFIYNTNATVICTFEYYGITNNTYADDINTILYKTEYNSYSYLDNAFEYSLHEFVDNSNIGRLNLVNWFTDVFLDSSNATNMLYLNFINWYMNYALLVSCVYILFLVLMWFVSLARRLIYKGMEI